MTHKMPPPAPQTFRIATLNTNSSPYHCEERYNNFLKWVKLLNPDVLLLQELESETTGQWFIEENNFKKETGLTYSISPAMTDTGCSIYSKLPFTQNEPDLLAFNADYEIPYRAVGMSGLTPAGNPAFYVSAHLPWGPYHEYARLESLRDIEQWSEKKAGESVSHSNPRVYLGGDFNAEPQHISLRWLRGEDYNTHHISTRWTDGWLNAQTKHGDLDGVTSTPHNPYALHTAQGHAKIPHPELLPQRRIDYLFIRGYAFGSQGTPMQAGVWGQEIENIIGAPSDHYGVWTDVLDLTPDVS